VNLGPFEGLDGVPAAVRRINVRNRQFGRLVEADRAQEQGSEGARIGLADVTVAGLQVAPIGAPELAPTCRVGGQAPGFLYRYRRIAVILTVCPQRERRLFTVRMSARPDAAGDEPTPRGFVPTGTSAPDC